MAAPEYDVVALPDNVKFPEPVCDNVRLFVLFPDRFNVPEAI
jgi:hypothetical protein